MDHQEAGRFWEANAEAWTSLSRQGYDVYRDKVNTPAFLDMLPPVSGLAGLDIGCGEGHNTRQLARLGARMTAFDISGTFLRHAQAGEGKAGPETPHRGIAWARASAVSLPFAAKSFDFATGFMSFMDIPDHPSVVAEAFRVLRPGGFLQFSISHPCFFTPRWRWLRDEAGRKVAVACGDYFRELSGEIEEWTFGAAPAELRQGVPLFRVPRFTRTLSSWLNLLTDAGFAIERLGEPRADERTAAECPHVADTRIVAYFLIVRARKIGYP
jgi:ubiquinone/menaquinone biosynthesis C-methylase UbiE